MKENQKYIYIALGVGIILLVLCYFFRIPMLDGELEYKNGTLFHVIVEQKLAFYDIFNSSDKLIREGLLPKRVSLKPLGWVILFIVHIGLPFLVYLRFYYSNQKKKLEKED